MSFLSISLVVWPVFSSSCFLDASAILKLSFILLRSITESLGASLKNLEFLFYC